MAFKPAPATEFGIALLTPPDGWWGVVNLWWHWQQTVLVVRIPPPWPCGERASYVLLLPVQHATRPVNATGTLRRVNGTLGCLARFTFRRLWIWYGGLVIAGEVHGDWLTVRRWSHA